MPTRTRILLGDGSEHHGTVNGYRNYKCRCDECREAWAMYFRRRRGVAKGERKYRPDDVG